MPPRLDPRRYVIRLAWLSRRPSNPRSISGRASFIGDRRGAPGRWPGSLPWRLRP